MEVSLKSGETVKGMLLTYDTDSITIQPSEDLVEALQEGCMKDFSKSRRVIKNSEIGVKLNNRYQLLKGL